MPTVDQAMFGLARVIEMTLQMVQGGQCSNSPTLQDLEMCGRLHRILEVINQEGYNERGGG